MTATSDASRAAPTSSAARPLRVAFACDWAPPRRGGLEAQLIGLAGALAARGHHVELITPTAGDERVGTLPVRRVPGLHMPLAGIVVTPTPFRAFRRVVADGAFDVVHVHSGIIAPFAYGTAMASARLGLPTAVTFHSVYAYLRPAFWTLAHAARAARRPIAWSAVSRLVAGEAEWALGVPAVDVLPNGIAPDLWRGAAGRAGAERRPGELRLVSVMRLHPRKRPHALFEILERAQAIVGPSERLTLDIVGDGGMRRRIERLAARAGAGRVRLHGWLPPGGVASLLARSHVFVLPTRMESFGIAALEAAYAGLPIVAYRGTGVEDFIQHGERGLLGRSDDELARSVGMLALDEPLRRRLGARNRADPPPLAWDAVAVHAESLYDRAIALSHEAGARAG